MYVLASTVYVAVLVVLMVYGLHRTALVLGAIGAARRRRASAQERPSLAGSQVPFVTVQLPLFNEQCVAERLLDAVAALDWPSNRLEIQVLDDSTDETVELCRAKVAELRRRRLLVRHLHRTDRTGFKAGALAAGLAVARGELLCVLDADFVPGPDFLRATVGHFSDPSVGMVQARWDHLNRDSSMLTRVQALLLDGHFAVEQRARAAGGRFFNFNGTAGIWRRETIEQAGGWQCDTLTEDLDLSYRALLCGWQFRYLPDVTAPAELPADMNAFKSQQFRWAKGSVQVARKLLPRVARADIPWQVKLEALFHLTQNLPYLATCLLALAFVPAVVLAPDPVIHATLLWDLTLLVGTTGALASYCAASQWLLERRRTSLVRGAARTVAVIAVTAGICVSQTRAVVEALLGKRSDFVRTPKCGQATHVQGLASIEDRGGTGSERTAVYRAACGWPVVLELGLALYFIVALVLAICASRWLAVPICALFAFGFLHVGVCSVRGSAA